MRKVFSFGSTPQERKSSFWLLLIGMFSMTQISVVGSVGISELLCFMLAPILFLIDYQMLRRDGFMPAVVLSLLAMAGCCISSIVNRTPMPAFLRGFAATYSLFVFLIVHHRLLRNNLGGIKWFLLGVCLSNIINVFVFQKAVETYMVGASGNEKMEAVVSGVLFWLNRVGPFLTLPARGWYLQTPTIVAVCSAMIMPVYTMATTDTGRSATAVAVVTVVLLAVVRKKVNTMRAIQRHILLSAVVALSLCVLLKDGYKFLAENGFLNEKATRKYEGQMAGQTKKGVVGVLLGGRTEFFGGIYAATKKPLVGYGPWAVDTDGIYRDFVARYGDWEDVEKFQREFWENVRSGRYGYMPAHSHIVGFWVQYGILGVFIWVYVLWLIYKLFRRNLSVIPQWYGFFAFTVCSGLWSILFSPYGDRVGMPFFIVALLMADAVRRGKIPLSPLMVEEISKYSYGERQ